MDKKELQKAQNIIDVLFYDDKVLTQWQHTLLENVISIAQTKLRKPPVMCCGLTEVEFTERERLLELQRSRTRWFSQQQFDRLKELSEKMFANAGSPHST